MKYPAIPILLFCLFPPPAAAITFAQLALGGGYEATLLITNKSAFSWSGQFRARQGADQRWAGVWSMNGQSMTGTDAATFSLAARQTVKFVFRGDSTVRNGYLEISAGTGSSTLDIATAYFYNYYSGGVLMSTTGSPESAWDTKMIFPVELASSVDTGYAIAPFIMDPPFQVKLTLYDRAGSQVAQKTISYSGQFAEFISQRFPGLAYPFIGHVLVESQYLVALEVLRMEKASDGRFFFTSTPADDYVP